MSYGDVAERITHDRLLGQDLEGEFLLPVSDLRGDARPALSYSCVSTFDWKGRTRW
jgi:hypothetical protein